jgi:type IV secretory pathway VirB10-like protein
MARRGFFSRIADAVRSVIPGRKSEPAKPAPERPAGKEIIDIVSPPPPRRPPGRGAPPILPSRPIYQASSDSWRGRNAPTEAEWEEIKQIAEANLSDPYAGFVYHTSIVGSRASGRNVNRKSTQVLDIPADLLGFTEPKDRYADIIKAIRTGEITADEMIERLEDQNRAWDSYSTSMDTSRGSAAWAQRNRGLPDSLYFYH